MIVLSRAEYKDQKAKAKWKQEKSLIVGYICSKVKIRELKFICGKCGVNSAWIFFALLKGRVNYSWPTYHSVDERLGPEGKYNLWNLSSVWL